jgi:dihydropteroate synthase
MFSVNCGGKLLSFDEPKIMAIINATPDSFYEGHLQKHIDELIAMSANMLDAGASILDVGGQSTRPDSETISAAEELKRVIPVIQAIHSNFPDAIISIDTYYSEVAARAVEAGATMVNDVSSGAMDAQMLQLVGSLKVPYVAMHMQGTPQNMQTNPSYKNITLELIDFFIQKIEQCKSAGIQDVIIDPGFGFGKTMDHNFELLRRLNDFSILKRPLLAGISRKSMIYKTLQSSPAEALNGTTVLNTIAIMNGAHLLRVHDVKEAREAILLTEKTKGVSN